MKEEGFVTNEEERELIKRYLNQNYDFRIESNREGTINFLVVSRFDETKEKWKRYTISRRYISLGISEHYEELLKSIKKIERRTKK